MANWSQWGRLKPWVQKTDRSSIKGIWDYFVDLRLIEIIFQIHIMTLK